MSELKFRASRQRLAAVRMLSAQCVCIFVALSSPTANAAISMIPDSEGFSSYPLYDGSDPWHQDTEYVYVGGNVIVDGGSDVFAGSTNYGVGLAGDTVSLTIQGAGSTWTDVSEVSPTINIGGYGTVSFNVLDGGAVSTNGAWIIARENLDFARIGHVSMTVSGAGSSWNVRGGDVELSADPNDSTVALHVLNGGQIVGGRSLTIGYGYEAGPALAEVRGVGSRISLSSIMSVSVSRDQGLRILEGGVVESSLGFVGQPGTDTSLAIVSGAGSRWSMGNDLFVGRDGGGEVRVLSGGTLASRRGSLGIRTSFGQPDQSSAGVVNVNGTNSVWTLSQTLTVASNDHGELIVKNGGKVTASALDVALSATSYATGSVGIDGENSLVQVAGLFRAGVNNEGNVGISNGADLISGSGLVNRSFFDVSGAGSTWSGGTKTVAPLGTLQVRAGGQVITSTGSQVTNQGVVRGDGTFGGTFSNQGTVRPGLAVGTLGALKVNGTFSQTSTGLLDIEIGSTGNDLLNIEGTASLAGSLHVATLAEGINTVVYTAWDRFEIVKATGGITGVFSSASLPTLPSNLYWRIDYGPNVVSLNVVPEPATIGMFVLVGLCAPMSRRRGRSR